MRKLARLSARSVSVEHPRLSVHALPLRLKKNQTYRMDWSSRFNFQTKAGSEQLPSSDAYHFYQPSFS